MIAERRARRAPAGHQVDSDRAVRASTGFSMGFQDAPSFPDADLAHARTSLGCRLRVFLRRVLAYFWVLPGTARRSEPFGLSPFGPGLPIVLARHGSRRPAGAGCPREPAQRATVAAVAGSLY